RRLGVGPRPRPALAPGRPAGRGRPRARAHAARHARRAPRGAPSTRRPAAEHAENRDTPTKEEAPMTDTSNTYLAGTFAPVRGGARAQELRVPGTIPSELVGRFLRIGPNPLPNENAATYHWFTGPGMVHGVRLRDGRAEWYRRRWVRSDRVTEF